MKVSMLAGECDYGDLSSKCDTTEVVTQQWCPLLARVWRYYIFLEDLHTSHI